MSTRNKVRSSMLNAYVSEAARRRTRNWYEAKRKLTGGAHRVTAFLQLDDPYSYLLAQYLPALAEHYDIDLQVRLSAAIDGEYQPAPDLLTDYAMADCARLAMELGLPFLDRGATPPVEYRRGLLDAAAAGVAESNEKLFQVLEIYWRGDAEEAEQLAGSSENGVADQLIAASQRELQKLGHYSCATLHYGGEWFAGVERLHYLLARLDELGLAWSASGHPRLVSISQVMQIDLPVVPPAAAQELPPLDLFFSFRSPYSHLSLRRVYELADAFNLNLILRPVLPMAMRGLPVPKKKIRYILRDAAREAELLHVPFGDAMDPVGEGVERCHAVFAYALTENRGREFARYASDMIWGGAVDVATDEGLRKVTAKAGLFWPEVKQALESEEWREEETKNRQLMLSLGSWGVPTLCIGDYVVWGQDRIWLLARHLEEMCDTGDGILV